MGWAQGRPVDASQQLLEYASTGRLVDLDPRVSMRNTDRGSTTLALVLAAAVMGIGTSLLVVAALTASILVALAGLSTIAAGLRVLLPSLTMVRLHTSSAGVTVKPGAVLPPRLIHKGNWIRRDGAWHRVEQVGRSGDGAITALLSSGDVIQLTKPVTIAGGDFRPTPDPVASLRN